MADPRQIKREYVKTPQLVQTGTHLPTTPVRLADGDWDGLRRLLEGLRQAINNTDGVTEEFDLADVTTLVFDRGKLISVE